MKKLFYLPVLCLFASLSFAIIACNSKEKEEARPATTSGESSTNECPTQPFSTYSIICRDSVLTLMKNFFQRAHINECQTLAQFISLDFINSLNIKIANYLSKDSTRDRDDLQVRIYFGRFSANAPDSLKNSNTVIITMAARKGEEFHDIENFGYYQATGAQCPRNCRGALLLEEANNSPNECVVDFLRVPKNTQVSNRWGNITSSTAFNLTNDFIARQFEDTELCKTLAVDLNKSETEAFFFAGDIIKADSVRNVNSNARITGRRIYFARYPGAERDPLKKNKVTVVLTLTEEVRTVAGKFNQDIISNNGNVNITPLNNGSRTPPGFATLVTEMSNSSVFSSIKQCLDTHSLKNKPL